jgi:hypothetical protein
MSDIREFDVAAVEVDVAFDDAHAGEDAVWTPDAVTVSLRPAGADEPVHHSDAAVEHLFLLLDQLERGETGGVLWGASKMLVEVSDGTVTLRHEGIHVTGPIDTVHQTVEDLLRAAFERLREDGVDPLVVAQDLADGRHAPWETNPVAVHNRFLRES